MRGGRAGGGDEGKQGRGEKEGEKGEGRRDFSNVIGVVNVALCVHFLFLEAR